MVLVKSTGSQKSVSFTEKYKLDLSFLWHEIPLNPSCATWTHLLPYRLGCSKREYIKGTEPKFQFPMSLNLVIYAPRAH